MRDGDGPSTRGAVAAHLERMHAQRVALFEDLMGVAEHRLWERPARKTWSPGEHLDHTRVLNACFRRLLSAAWPVVSPWPALLPGARRRLERPYATDIDDVYQRPSMPSWVGFMWPPRRTPKRPASLAELERVLAYEHCAIARFYTGKPERLLGHVTVWDPAIVRLNLVQALRVGVHHDLHHYTAVRRLLGSCPRPSRRHGASWRGADTVTAARCGRRDRSDRGACRGSPSGA